jgi:phenylpropionate dioxygenase-like ring-hydroxylating dioxygenase large terminal subunit
MYARNHWYAVGLSSELNEAILVRTVLDEQIIAYRTNDGEVVALEDRCSHRNAPLSLGKRIGDSVQCPYHGLEFGRGGACTKIPRLDHNPSAAYAIRAYPAIERDQYVWFWPGDPAQADPALIPDYSWQSQDGWTGAVWLKTVKASYLFNNDNLLDLSHTEYVHPNTFSSDTFKSAVVVTEVHETHIDMYRNMLGLSADDPEVIRWLFGREPPAEHFQVDRISHLRFMAPSNFWLHHRMYRVGYEDSTDVKMDRFGGPNTPETASSYHHFMSAYRNYALDDEALTRQMVDLVNTGYSEDEVILTKQQERVDAGKYRPIRPFAVDKTALEGARIVARLIEREQSR